MEIGLCVARLGGWWNLFAPALRSDNAPADALRFQPNLGPQGMTFACHRQRKRESETRPVVPSSKFMRWSVVSHAQTHTLKSPSLPPPTLPLSHSLCSRSGRSLAAASTPTHTRFCETPDPYFLLHFLSLIDLFRTHPTLVAQG